ncbi:uncharacterized protein LOC141813297 [Curcuma longa]|uniref:uncharacterized protein LOC141813297 n=1 Tax=Curcuma longa TaxID=136217 RepID=UPI003D9F8ABD
MAVPRTPKAHGHRAAGKSKKPDEAASSSVASPRKRTKSPGVRVVGGRIYDSERGMTCHQCRQKTMDFAAACKQMKGNKICTIKFCHKCLLNRYGENAEQVAVLENWSCPKCRGVCNCSFCMKKKGQQPTGILIHAAKATGFTSVHDLLDNKGSEVLIAANGLRCLSAGNPPCLKRGTGALKRSRNLEKFPDGRNDVLSVDGGAEKDESLLKNERTRSSKKLKFISENSIELADDNAKPKNGNKQAKDVKKISVKSKNDEMHSGSNWPRSPKQSDGCEGAVIVQKEKLQVKPTSKKPVSQKHVTGNSNIAEANVLVDTQNTIANGKSHLKEDKSMKCVIKVNQPDQENVAPVVPLGTPLLEVAGSDWAAEDVGAALQFLEFCNAFSEVLDVNKGEPECVLRELARGRVGSRGLYSSVVKFHVKLLSFIQKDMGEDSISFSVNGGDKWLQSLVKYIDENASVLKMSLDFLKKDSLSYDNLDCSNKLRLLNLLCDMTLGTEALRNWIDEENNKYIERKKEAKENIIAAKKKGNDLKKKLKDDVAKAMLSLRDKPLSVAEHEKLVSHIRTKAERARAEMLKMMELLPTSMFSVVDALSYYINCF